jgi:hypothetical protein
VRKIIEKFNDLKIEKFAPETAELELFSKCWDERFKD